MIQTGYKLSELLPFLPKDVTIVEGAKFNHDYTFCRLLPTAPAASDALIFIDHKRTDQQELAEKSHAKFIICSHSVELSSALEDKVLIRVAQPKFIFSVIGNALFVKKREWGIHPSSVIHPEAIIHANSYIGPNCTIGKVKISENTIIEGNNFLYDGVEIGSNVLIYAGSVIGSVGYGYVRDETGFPIQFPHVGRVIIEDFVEIGSNTTIDIGALNDTIIGWGSKLDNLVHIGHNVVIGKCVYIAACSSIAGSSKIGDYSNVWTGVRVADGIRIGKRSYIGMGSVVISDIPDNKKCFGNPARVIGSIEE